VPKTSDTALEELGVDQGRQLTEQIKECVVGKCPQSAVGAQEARVTAQAQRGVCEGVRCTHMSAEAKVVQGLEEWSREKGHVSSGDVRSEREGGVPGVWCMVSISDRVHIMPQLSATR
jgi:hypothetical protein